MSKEEVQAKSVADVAHDNGPDRKACQDALQGQLSRAVAAGAGCLQGVLDIT